MTQRKKGLSFSKSDIDHENKRVFFILHGLQKIYRTAWTGNEMCEKHFFEHSSLVFLLFLRRRRGRKTLYAVQLQPTLLVQ